MKMKLLWMLLLTPLAGALDWNSSGQISMSSVWSQKPSSIENQSAFRLPESRLGVQVKPFDEMSGSVEVSYGKIRETTDPRYSLKIDRAFLQFDGVFAPSLSIQYGLIPDSWTDMEERFWGYRDLGERAQALALRYGYLNRSDLGVGATGSLEDWGRWSLSVVNGEGPGADEKGPRKDVQLTIEARPLESFRQDRRWTVAASLIEGGYDNIDAQICQKERVLGLIAFEQPTGFQGSVEWLSTKDPVDGLKNVADRVDLTDQGGQVARGAATSLVIKYRAARPEGLSFYEIFARVDRLDPAVGVNDKGLQERMLGIGFFPRQHLQFSLAWSDVIYGAAHASSVSDVSEYTVAASLKW